MKKLLPLVILTLCLAGCGASDESIGTPADLRGDWIESTYTEKDTYMIATVTDDTIEVNWCSDGGESTAIYWVGTYTAPTESGDYTWDSVRDKERTDSALLASDAETKTFTYTNGEITYDQSALGTTVTVHLIPVE